MPRLSTHALDTANGRPAQGIVIDLHRIDAGGSLSLVKTVETNSDGRTDQPLLSGDAFQTGTYQLTFHIGAYFARMGNKTAAIPFLDLVPIRFSMAEPDGHYHVPLSFTPWSYSTYRGS